MGIYIRCEEQSYKISRCAGFGDSSLAEAIAVLEAVRQCMRLFAPPCVLQIHCDSQALVGLIRERSSPRERQMTAILAKIHRLLGQARKQGYRTTVQYISRRKNKTADGLAYLALAFLNDPMWEDLEV